MDVVGAIAIGVLITILASEALAWMPRIRASSIRIAAKLSPKKYQERLLEEWSAHLDSLPGEIAKTLVAMDFIRSGFLLGLRESAFIPSVMARVVGVLVAIIFILLTAPTILWLYWMARSNGGGLAYSERVIGKGGRRVAWITISANGALGRYLKVTRIGNVPMLARVLRGDIALVGPRPRSDLSELGAASEKYVRLGPGLFNPSAANFYDNVDLADVAYLEERSVLGDLKIAIGGMVSWFWWRSNDVHRHLGTNF